MHKPHFWPGVAPGGETGWLSYLTLQCPKLRNSPKHFHPVTLSFFHETSNVYQPVSNHWWSVEGWQMPQWENNFHHEPFGDFGKISSAFCWAKCWLSPPSPPSPHRPWSVDWQEGHAHALCMKTIRNNYLLSYRLLYKTWLLWVSGYFTYLYLWSFNLSFNLYIKETNIHIDRDWEIDVRLVNVFHKRFRRIQTKKKLRNYVFAVCLTSVGNNFYKFTAW